MDLSNDQLAVCRKYQVIGVPSAPNRKVGISMNVKDGVLPVHGLRHPPEGETTGWYIWAGEEFSTDPNFFVPLHVAHLQDWCPGVLQYLGLPPGWRFLIGPNYEDVWEDKFLLNI